MISQESHSVEVHVYKTTAQDSFAIEGGEMCLYRSKLFNNTSLDEGTPHPRPHDHVTVLALEGNVCGPSVSSSLPEDYPRWRSTGAEPNHSLWWLIWVSHMCGHTLSEHRWSHILDKLFLQLMRQEVCHVYLELTPMSGVCYRQRLHKNRTAHDQDGLRITSFNETLQHVQDDTFKAASLHLSQRWIGYFLYLV